MPIIASPLIKCYDKDITNLSCFSYLELLPARSLLIFKLYALCWFDHWEIMNPNFYISRNQCIKWFISFLLFLPYNKHLRNTIYLITEINLKISPCHLNDVSGFRKLLHFFPRLTRYRCYINNFNWIKGDACLRQFFTLSSFWRFCFIITGNSKFSFVLDLKT